MPFFKPNTGGGSGSLSGEKFLLIAPVTHNGYTGKNLPRNAFIKHIIIKSNMDESGFQLGTTANGDDLVYYTDLQEYTPEIVSPLLFNREGRGIFVSGLSGSVIKILIIYQLVNL